MTRRNMVATVAASGLLGVEGAVAAAQSESSILELKTWYLHNSSEDQPKRLAAYFQSGLAPALERAGVKLDGVFSNYISSDGPYYVTLTEYANVSSMAQANEKLRADAAHAQAAKQLSSGGAPFVRVESSLLRSFEVMPKIDRGSSGKGSRIFELRTYEAPSFPALTRKVGMFNEGEAAIFKRLGMRPVFFGETLVGPRQPNLTYMLSYDDLAAREKLWQSFISDAEWKKLSANPELKDSEIVSKISNVILKPLSFSPVR